MIGSPPELAYLDIDDLWVNPVYQRGTDSDRSKQVIRHIVKAFDWSKFQPVLVARSPSGKKYSIIDGQHRVLAAIERGDIEQVPCCIVDLPDIAKQADSFVSVNKFRVNLHPMQIFRASVASGDKSAVALTKFLGSIGIMIPRSPAPSGMTKPNEVQAIGTLQRIFRRQGGEEALKFALTSILRAYPDEHAQMRSMMIQCLAEVYFRWGGVSEEIVTKVLHETDPETLQEMARENRKKQTGAILTIMLGLFVSEYNKHAGDKLALQLDGE